MNIRQKWGEYISNIDYVLAELNKKPIIALGVIPYSRVVPALFLNNYIIFCAKDCKDIKLMREFSKIICLEERYPKIASKVKSTGYLLQNFTFQNFLKNYKAFDLFFYNITPFMFEGLSENNWPYIGNTPQSQEEFLFKYSFRQLLRKLNLPHLDNFQIPRQEFITKNFADIYKMFNNSFVCQRGDLDHGGEISTFFIHNADEFESVKSAFKNDDRFSIVEAAPFIEGPSCSMIGCATKQGVFTSSLNMQLIDIKESLIRATGKGVFVGHDFGLKPWPDKIEKEAVSVVEILGNYLYQKGYKGVFGIDFLYDEKNQKIYPLECNPRFTGSFPIISLLSIMNQTPPFDLIHIIEHKNINAIYDFEKLNNAFKQKTNYSHLLINGYGLKTMPIDMPIGIYSYNERADEIVFERPAILPWEIENPDEFLVADAILKEGAEIGDGAVKLFKIVFPSSIALNSYELKPKFAKIVKIFSDLIHNS